MLLAWKDRECVLTRGCDEDGDNGVRAMPASLFWAAEHVLVARGTAGRSKPRARPGTAMRTERSMTVLIGVVAAGGGVRFYQRRGEGCEKRRARAAKTWTAGLVCRRLLYFHCCCVASGRRSRCSGLRGKLFSVSRNFYLLILPSTGHTRREGTASGRGGIEPWTSGPEERKPSRFWPYFAFRRDGAVKTQQKIARPPTAGGAVAVDPTLHISAESSSFFYPRNRSSERTRTKPGVSATCMVTINRRDPHNEQQRTTIS